MKNKKEIRKLYKAMFIKSLYEDLTKWQIKEYSGVNRSGGLYIYNKYISPDYDNVSFRISEEWVIRCIWFWETINIYINGKNELTITIPMLKKTIGSIAIKNFYKHFRERKKLKKESKKTEKLSYLYNNIPLSIERRLKLEKLLNI